MTKELKNKFIPVFDIRWEQVTKESEWVQSHVISQKMAKWLDKLGPKTQIGRVVNGI